MTTIDQKFKIKPVGSFKWFNSNQTSNKLKRHKSLPVLYKPTKKSSNGNLEISEKMTSLQTSHSERDITNITTSHSCRVSGGCSNKLKPLVRGINFKHFHYDWQRDVSLYTRNHISLIDSSTIFRSYNSFYRQLGSDLIYDPKLARVNLDEITHLDVKKVTMFHKNGETLSLNYKDRLNFHEYHCLRGNDECRDVQFWQSFSALQYQLYKFILPLPTNGILEYLMTLEGYACNKVLDQAREVNLFFAALAVRNAGLLIRGITSVTFSDFFSDDCLRRLYYSASNAELFDIVSNFASLGTKQVTCSLEEFYKDKNVFENIVLYPLPKLIEMQIARNIQFYLHWFLAVSFQDWGFHRVSFMNILPNAVGQIKESVDIIIQTQKTHEYFRKLREDHKALLVLHMILAELRLSVGCQGEVFEFSDDSELEYM